MTREILFRAKRKNNGEWVYGHLLGLLEKVYISYLPIQMTEVYPDTICQYTGLTDKNGTKIFENDVVSIGGELCTVRWQKDTARFVLNDDVARAHCDFGNYWGYQLEVVGNIFDKGAGEHE